MMDIWCNDKLAIGWSVSTDHKQANKNKACNYVKLLQQMDELTGPNVVFFCEKILRKQLPTLSTHELERMRH